MTPRLTGALYLDNDVSVRAAPPLQALGLTVTTTAQLNRRTAGDHEQLLLAARRQWVLVTHNWDDFRLLHGAWHLWARDWAVSPVHSGILVTQHGPVQEIVETVAGFLAAHSADQIANTLWRHRRSTGWVMHQPWGV